LSLPATDEIVTGSLILLAILAIEIPWEEEEEMVDSTCDTERELKEAEEEMFEVREGIIETDVVCG